MFSDHLHRASEVRVAYDLAGFDQLARRRVDGASGLVVQHRLLRLEQPGDASGSWRTVRAKFDGGFDALCELELPVLLVRRQHTVDDAGNSHDGVYQFYIIGDEQLNWGEGAILDCNVQSYPVMSVIDFANQCDLVRICDGEPINTTGDSDE